MADEQQIDEPLKNKAGGDRRYPSRNLEPSARGYGIGGGYERPYRKRPRPADARSESYGPVPHSGYYGVGAESDRFERGKAGFKDELSWYTAQYGERTIGEQDKT